MKARCTAKSDNGRDGEERLVTYQFNKMFPGKDRNGKDIERAGVEVAKFEVKGGKPDEDKYQVGKDYDIDGK